MFSGASVCWSHSCQTCCVLQVWDEGCAVGEMINSILRLDQIVIIGYGVKLSWEMLIAQLLLSTFKFQSCHSSRLKALCITLFASFIRPLRISAAMTFTFMRGFWWVSSFNSSTIWSSLMFEIVLLISFCTKAAGLCEFLLLVHHGLRGLLSAPLLSWTSKLDFQQILGFRAYDKFLIMVAYLHCESVTNLPKNYY